MQNLNLAVIGNCRIGALIDQKARISWAGFPNFDSDPVFCSLLGGDAPDDGFLDIDIARARDYSQHYRRNTPVLITEVTTEDGYRLRITDFSPRFRNFDRMFRPPMLIRRIEPLEGTPQITVRMRPMGGYGAAALVPVMGSNHISYTDAAQALRLTTNAPISYVVNEAPFPLDGPVYLIVHANESLATSIVETAEDFLRKTTDYWQDWVRYLSVPFEWQEAVIRAAITVKLCSNEETGAIVAALTTSIPEAPHSGRCWDYRYCWLRDAFFVVQALNRLSATRTMEEFIRYITTVAALERSDGLKPVYGIVPTLSLAERTVEHLPGYRGMGPVRVGNQAAEQIQHDSYGNVILAAAQMFFDRRLPRPPDPSLFHTLEALGEKAADVALKPDAGLWEYRGRERVHTFSAMMSWAACDRLAKISPMVGFDERAAYWRAHADRIRKGILAEGVDRKRGCLVESFGGDGMDASLLLAHAVGFMAPDDPIFLATLDECERELRAGNLLYRYRMRDDFGEPETAFTVCAFWFVDALAAVGRTEEAREMFEELLRYRNALGLYSEDVAPKTGELWGNFPQTYSMVGLINSAMRLSRSWEDAFWRGS